MFETIEQAFDQLNPLSTTNVTIYFTWVVVYVFTAAAIWRSNYRWVRLCCFLINQIFSIGIFISLANILVPAVTYWVESLIAAAATGLVSWWIFRPRKKRVKHMAARGLEPALNRQPDAPALAKAESSRPEPMLDPTAQSARAAPPPEPKLLRRPPREGQDVEGKDLSRLTEDWLSGTLPTEKDKRGK